MNSNSLNESKISNFSNHSVLNLSLDSSYSKNSDIESLNSSYFSNNSFRKKIYLPIENEPFNNLLCEEDEKEIIFSPMINSELANYFLENNTLTFNSIFSIFYIIIHTFISVSFSFTSLFAWIF